MRPLKLSLSTPAKKLCWTSLGLLGSIPASPRQHFGGHLEWVEELRRGYIKRNFNMGAGQSAEIPGGGSEGYHVLRVIYDRCNLHNWFENSRVIRAYKLGFASLYIVMALESYLELNGAGDSEPALFYLPRSRFRKILLGTKQDWNFSLISSFRSKTRDW